MSKETKSPTIFYGWFVVAACFAVTLSLGESFWAFGVFFKPLEDEFGWSRALVSSGYTAFLLGYTISVVTAGRLADRYSPRPVVLASALLSGLGISLCSQTQSINQLRFFLFIAGLGAGATWSVPASVVQRWFYKRKRAGLALSIVSTGVGVGALIFTPLINYLILNYGWRNAYLTVGILFFIIIAVSSLVIKRSPTYTRTGREGNGIISKSASTEGWPTAKVVISAPFVGLVFITCVGSLTTNIVSVHLIPHAADVGISETAAAVALGLTGGFSIPGRLASGFISDRIGWQKVLAFSLFGAALSIICLLFLKGLWMLYLFAFLYGICWGIRAPAQAGILSAFFGMRSLGELIGITSAIGQFVSAFAPYMAGFIFDTTSSYSIAFIIVMVFLFAGGIITTIISKPLVTSK